MRISPSKVYCVSHERAMLSQREVARHWGVSRATIQRAIKAGKLSVLADKTLDPSEVVRVFGEPASRPDTRPTEPDEPTKSRVTTLPETAILEAEIGHLKAMLAEKDARIEDLRGALKLLTNQRPTPTKGLWERLTSRRTAKD